MQLILEPRGSLKTTILIAYILRRIVKNPNIRILIACEELALAKTILAGIVSIIENNEVFKALYGDLKGPNPKTWHQESILVCTRTDTTLKEATITCTAIGVTKTGFHYDLIIVDDPHSEKNTGTADQIQKVIRWYGLLLSLLDPGKKLIVVGTIWHFGDLFSWIMAKEREREGKGLKKRFHILKKKAWHTRTLDDVKSDADLLWPERLDKEFLENQRIEQGAYRFGCFYANEAVDDDSAVFKKSWVKFHLKVPRYVNTYATVDVVRDSEEDSVTDDHAAIVVVSFDTDWHGYIRDIRRGKWDEYDTLEEIINVWRIWKPRRIGVETNAWQKVYYRYWKAELARRGLSIPISQLKTDYSANGKVMRIKSMVPYWKSGLFSIPGTSIELLEGNWAILMDELLNFPRTNTRDTIDALSYINQVSKRPSPLKIIRQIHPDSFQAHLNRILEKNPQRLGAENVR